MMKGLRCAALVMVGGLTACQSAPVYYQAGPRPMNGAEVYAQALRSGQAQARQPVNCQTFVYPNGQAHTTCQ